MRQFVQITFPNQDIIIPIDGIDHIEKDADGCIRVFVDDELYHNVSIKEYNTIISLIKVN